MLVLVDAPRRAASSRRSASSVTGPDGGGARRKAAGPRPEARHRPRTPPSSGWRPLRSPPLRRPVGTCGSEKA